MRCLPSSASCPPSGDRHHDEGVFLYAFDPNRAERREHAARSARGAQDDAWEPARARRPRFSLLKDIPFPVPITSIDEVHIQFERFNGIGQGYVSGSMDRVTGDVKVSAH